jgi:ring-1,2-phenylacetyl-CoA epoxidase subunit PaaC
MSTVVAPPHLASVLRLADTALVLGQRLSEWCGHGPVLEEDIALSNIALDEFGQARLLLTHAAAIEGRGRDEDQLAFLRSPPEYLNLTIVELPNGDFARTMLRVLFVAAYQCEIYAALAGSSDDADLAAIAAKSLKECAYHRQHAADWVIRLGDGTDESHRRAQGALDALWPYTTEFFAEAGEETDPAAAVEAAWSSVVLPVLEVATLKVPARTPFASRGKSGVHSEHLGHLLAEMQYLQRAHPGAAW